MNTPASVPGIQAETDLCVKCGLCLPHCPTWRIHHREGDSPRGRVELIAALAGGQVEPGPASQARLDGCLLCRACESVCPARVPFGHLMDQARERWPARGIWWGRLFCSAMGRALLRFGFWLAAASGLARIGQPLLALLPEAVVLRRKRLSKTGSLEVGLFTGCVSDAVDRATLNDAATLLEHCGARVAWIEGSGCCGCTGSASRQCRECRCACPGQRSTYRLACIRPAGFGRHRVRGGTDGLPADARR